MSNRAGSIPVKQINNHKITYICGAQSLTLPAPDFENHEKYSFTRVNQRTRGGDLIVYRQDYWPKSKTLSMQFSRLNRLQRDAVFAFVQLTLGQLMTIVTQENVVYQGVIVTPEVEMKESLRDQSVVTIDFETIS